MNRLLFTSAFSVLVLAASTFTGLALYRERVFAANPNNWETDYRQIHNVTDFRAEPAGLGVTSYSYVADGKWHYFSGGSFMRGDVTTYVLEASPGEPGYAEVWTSYIKPWGIYHRRLGRGGFTVMAPRQRWVVHLPSEITTSQPPTT